MTFTELVGGLLLMAGLLTRLAAIALTIDLVIAIILVKSLDRALGVDAGWARPFRGARS